MNTRIPLVCPQEIGLDDARHSDQVVCPPLLLCQLLICADYTLNVSQATRLDPTPREWLGSHPNRNTDSAVV